MDTQFVLRVIGIAALVVSALFAVLAVHYYLTRDIRAVMDDLSGKTRARGVAGVRRSAAKDRKRETTRRAAASPVEDESAQPQGWAPQASQSMPTFAPPEEGTGTSAIPAQVEDELETIVEPFDEPETMVEMVEMADEPETMVEAGDDLDATELPDDTASAAYRETRPSLSREADLAGAASSAQTGFQVSRRVVHMPASQVIAASEESGQ